MNLVSWLRAQWDRALAVTCFALGGLFLVVGWSQVSHEALTAAQVPYVISGGLGGLFLLGLGAVFWLSADLRDEWRKLDEIEHELERRPKAPQESRARATFRVQPSSDIDVPPSGTNGTAPEVRRKRPIRGAQAG